MDEAPIITLVFLKGFTPFLDTGRVCYDEIEVAVF